MLGQIIRYTEWVHSMRGRSSGGGRGGLDINVEVIRSIGSLSHIRFRFAHGTSVFVLTFRLVSRGGCSLSCPRQPLAPSTECGPCSHVSHLFWRDFRDSTPTSEETIYSCGVEFGSQYRVGLSSYRVGFGVQNCRHGPLGSPYIETPLA